MNVDVGTIYLLIAGSLLLISTLKDRQKTKKALMVSLRMALMVFPVLFLVFTLMGLMGALVPREVIATWLGSGSGLLSILLGEVIGAVALILPAAVFPFSGFLHDQGANYGALVGFIMTAILMGVSSLPLEIKVFGLRFTVVRNVLTFLLVFVMGVIFLEVF
jgi:uncharacterized membrane protein YraQ (UPF0718 family)